MVASASASASASATIALRPPGVVIDHVAAATGAYVGSPSIAVLPDGSYVASHDYFGPATKNDESVIFGSSDRGEHWSKLADVQGQWWSTLFVHDKRLYFFGTSKRFGHIILRRSDDGGRTWTPPAQLTSDTGYHCAPVPIAIANGRLWRAFEDTRRDGEERGFKAFVISAPANADLMNAASWTISSGVRPEQSWLGGEFENWLEGNAVVDPNNRIVDVLRVNSRGNTEHAAIVSITSDGADARFDPVKDFVNLPGGSKKFTIRFDPQSHLYWTLANAVPQPHTGNHTDKIRNTLTLESSPDLAAWTERAVVLHHDDRATHGFHYVDWLFDGDDIIAVSRTAYDDEASGAHSAHDANYLTFHRVTRFRDSKSVSPSIASAWENADIAISGDFAMDTLDEGKRAFTNRAYVWSSVPARLRGASFTRIAGGESPVLRVRAKRRAMLTIATSAGVAGWDAEGSRLVYDDAKHSEMIVLTKQLAAGEEVTLPKGAWSSAIVITK